MQMRLVPLPQGHRAQLRETKELELAQLGPSEEGGGGRGREDSEVAVVNAF